MIAGLSKAINLYLAPLLSLTAFILILFSYLAPVILFPTQVAGSGKLSDRTSPPF